MARLSIQFDINENLYIRDPQSSSYGQKLLSNAILLFDEVGFEAFTFKKLAFKISSTEASVYRYFENKHTLLLYLVCWYWERVNYLIDINLKNITEPVQKLKIVIHQIVNASNEDALTDYINPKVLHHVVIHEGAKAYHIHNVDKENKQGFFIGYKDLVRVVSEILLEIDAEFPYPKILSSNMFEMANNQIYFAEHLPKLTDIKNSKQMYTDLENAMFDLVQRTLNL